MPVRQWVLSLPHRLRYVLAWDHALSCKYVNRRRFLLQAAGGLPLALVAVPGVAARALDADAPVVVIGAGLAGLRTADLLHKAGTPVIVLEARARPGGRVVTVRTPFDDGLHAEAGPVRIATAHRSVLQAVRAYTLPLVPLTASGADVTVIDGRPASTLQEQRVWMLDLKPDERMKMPADLLNRYVGELPRELGDPAASPAAFARWTEYERMTWPQCRQVTSTIPDVPVMYHLSYARSAAMRRDDAMRLIGFCDSPCL